MTYAEKVRESIGNLTEEDAKRYLGDIVVNYALRGEHLIAEDDYIKSIQTVMKIASADELRRNKTELELNVPKFKL